jgi:hypothetical protein
MYVHNGEEKLPIQPEAIVQLLRDAGRHGDPSGSDPMLDHHVSGILDYLERQGVDINLLASLEWTWLPVLRHTPRGAKSLRVVVTDEPELFCQLLELGYRARDEPMRELSDAERRAAGQAANLLREVKRVPGLISAVTTEQAEGDITFCNGEVDEGKLTAWVSNARERAAKVNRLGSCDGIIGGMLAYSPSDPTGVWPCIAVRNLIESVESDRLDNGLQGGVYNRRGVHLVQPGGVQELYLAEKFRSYAASVRSQWPRTGRLLDALAERFERDAKRNVEREQFEEYE